MNRGGTGHNQYGTSPYQFTIQLQEQKEIAQNILTDFFLCA
jgi:hypothetical protein